MKTPLQGNDLTEILVLELPWVVNASHHNKITTLKVLPALVAHLAQNKAMKCLVAKTESLLDVIIIS